MLILVTYFTPGIMLPSSRWAGYAAHVGEMRKGCKILLDKPEGWRLLERYMIECVSNVRLVLTEIGYETLSLINLDENREYCQAVVRMILDLQVVQNAEFVNCNS